MRDCCSLHLTTESLRERRTDGQVGGETDACAESAAPTSADGPVVAPAHVAVRHAQAGDALGALELVAFVAGEVHRRPPPVGGESK